MWRLMVISAQQIPKLMEWVHQPFNYQQLSNTVRQYNSLASVYGGNISSLQLSRVVHMMWAHTSGYFALVIPTTVLDSFYFLHLFFN